MLRHPILGGTTEPPKSRVTLSAAIQALAGLSQVVLGLVAYQQLNTPRALWIVALGAALIALVSAGPVIRQLGAWWRRRQDDRTARRIMPELQSLVRAFGKLVSSDRNDTLQAGLQDAFRNHANVLELLRVPSVQLFGEMVHNLVVRLDEEPADAAHVIRALDEFHTLIGAHSRQCMEPVFRSMPKDARNLLTPEARGVVNSYRERYVAFHAAFAKFTEDLGASLRASRLHQTYFVFRPDALN